MRKFAVAAAAVAMSLTALSAPASASYGVPTGDAYIDYSTLSGWTSDGFTPSVVDGYIEFDVDQQRWSSYTTDIRTIEVELPSGMSWSTDGSYNDASVWGDCSWSGSERISGRTLKLSGVSCNTDGDEYYDFSVSVDDSQILSLATAEGTYGISLDYRSCDNRGRPGCKFPAWETHFNSGIDIYVD